ncbi:hypothetical protein H5410_019161 [Solanum commersonii]|uniref:FMN hydroxy acid dehydrogenase domain-containing protein n=1 Tax=Solanum commersonii TaxID=4109 RepID=A0A9J6A478_SOLCO|nr:hypothetical protein H5410_019161 [Solanum commersonii]
MAGEPVNVNEFQELARKVLPKMYYDFFAGGAEDEYTLKENIEAFHRITIQPRILVDVSRIDMSTVILGHKTSAPIILAPSAAHQLAHPEGTPTTQFLLQQAVVFMPGEVATARGAAACNVIMGLSFMSTCTVEEVASSCNAVRFFQIYVYKRRDVTEFMVRRAESNGFRAIILTADTPRIGRREADIKNNNTVLSTKSGNCRMISFRLRNFEGLISTDVVPGFQYTNRIETNKNNQTWMTKKYQKAMVVPAYLHKWIGISLFGAQPAEKGMDELNRSITMHKDERGDNIVHSTSFCGLDQINPS